MGAKNIGKVLTEKHKKKIIAGNKGKKYKKRKPCTDEYRKKMSEAMMGKNNGKKHSQEWIDKFKKATNGKKN